MIATLRPTLDEIEVSHPDKTYFPEDGITKGDVVGYYRRVADRMVPLMRGHPVAMLTYPGGITHEGYFRKDAPPHFPPWLEMVTLPKKGGATTYVLCQDGASLVYVANQNTLTPHLLLAPADTPQHPDRMILDLDPSDDDFSKVRRAARIVRTALDELDLPSYPMTSGSRGIHIWVPLDGSADFATVGRFARDLAELVVRRHPDLLTVEMRKAKRGDRVFVDHLRNAYLQHAVAPYAVRAKPGAPVACPVAWSEVSDSALTPTRYTIGNLFRRLSKIDDPWAGMPRRAVRLAKRADRLGRLLDAA